jgi:hypothetical protein
VLTSMVIIEFGKQQYSAHRCLRREQVYMRGNRAIQTVHKEVVPSGVFDIAQQVVHTTGAAPIVALYRISNERYGLRLEMLVPEAFIRLKAHQDDIELVHSILGRQPLIRQMGSSHSRCTHVASSRVPSFRQERPVLFSRDFSLAFLRPVLPNV